MARPDTLREGELQHREDVRCRACFFPNLGTTSCETLKLDLDSLFSYYYEHYMNLKSLFSFLC